MRGTGHAQRVSLVRAGGTECLDGEPGTNMEPRLESVLLEHSSS